MSAIGQKYEFIQLTNSTLKSVVYNRVSLYVKNFEAISYVKKNIF
jgi:hypothetical protein